MRRRVVGGAVKAERGRRLAAMRLRTLAADRKPLSQSALGRRVGLSGQQVSKYETGRDLLTASVAFRFSRALPCPFTAIYSVGLLDLAEEAPAFAHDGAEDRLASTPAEMLALALQRLGPDALAMLRDVAVELLDEQETAPSVARP